MMEPVEIVSSINSNYIVIALIALFFSLNQILNTQFNFLKRKQHLLHNFPFYVIFFISNFTWAVFVVFSIEWLNKNKIELCLPVWLNLILCIAIINMATPNLHKAHLEQDEFHTNSNYTDVFVIWDRLFGTFKYNHPNSLKEFDYPKKQTFWYLLKTSFININQVK